MGLLMSDMLPIDPLVHETMRWFGGLTEWAYPSDDGRDVDDGEEADRPV